METTLTDKINELAMRINHHLDKPVHFTTIFRWYQKSSTPTRKAATALELATGIDRRFWLYPGHYPMGEIKNYDPWEKWLLAA